MVGQSAYTKAQIVSLIVVALQIAACSAEQRFVLGPSDVSVVEGETAEMKCLVEDRRGRLQWTKDGFALGFDYQIPGYPTYRMDVDESVGKYNLIIENASLSDDAEYQCQVGPVPDHSALLGRAHLSLIIPPKAPTIEGYLNGSQVKVSHTERSLNLTCESRDGKPMATFRWLRNGEELNINSSDVIRLETNVTSEENKLSSGWSLLTISPRDRDNEAWYTCETVNEAMAWPSNISVQLSVLYPPGIPLISGYPPGHIVKSNDTVDLRCVSHGGNPLAQLHWYRNEQKHEFSYTLLDGHSENQLRFTVVPSDNGAVYRCAASNEMTTVPLSASVRLTVYFAPEKVLISGLQSAKAGEAVTLKCETAISNPPATVNWFVRGRPEMKATSVTKPSAKGGFVTTSEIRVTAAEHESNVICQCYATNNAMGAQMTVVETFSLQVLYPPDPPIITGYIEGHPVNASTVLSISCSSFGGNPPATLTWFKGAKQLEADKPIGGTSHANNYITSQLSVGLRPDDNGAEYICTAKSPAMATNLSTSVRLTVYFPPSGLSIQLSPPEVKVGHPLTIYCNSSSSNPPSKISWWKHSKDEVYGVDGGLAEAEFGGRRTMSRLEITPEVTDDGKIYECRATNVLLSHTVSDAVTLSVLYKPYFSSSVPTSMSVIEDQTVVLLAAALGNPSDLVYSWYRGDSESPLAVRLKRRAVSGARFWHLGPKLNITQAKREDAGVYTVKAKNAEGFATHAIHLNVHYPAAIKSLTNNVVVNLTGTALLECTVDANPLDVPALITWTKVELGQNMTRVTIEDVVPGTSRLRIVRAVKEDSGIFRCTASNGIGTPAVGIAELLVQYPPNVDKSPAFGKSAADKGSMARLHCKADGIPAVNFTWFKDAVKIEGGENSSYTITEIKNSGPVTYESEMHVLNTAKSDYGVYRCVAFNGLGEDFIDISLDGTSRPDSPDHLTLLNSTHNSVTLSWRPGFDGGATAHYQVHYNEVGSQGMKYEDVVPSSATKFTIGGLKSGTEYAVRVIAINRLGLSVFQDKPLLAKTKILVGDDVPLIIILTVCIVGMLLLALNILLILFFIRRRRKKSEKDDDDLSSSVSQANTLEMINSPGEDYKSYTTYDQHSIDDIDEKMPLERITEERYVNPSQFYAGGGGALSSRPDQGMYSSYPSAVRDSREGLFTGNEGQGYTDGYRAGPYSSGGVQTRRGDNVNEDDVYTDQLRRVQQNLTSAPRGMGSMSHLPVNVQSPPYRVPSRPALNEAPSGPFPENYNNYPQYRPDADYRTNSSLNRRVMGQPTPPELRGHLV